ncbi:hypothetical protein [Vibrio crassostreae]|uniref:hypothetical protein n=1 Tax=Vibrio crassostreae TaxID=246167 RepID=UPI001B314C79|nr:hypothetical protein [Vibrio crassostreae]
MYKQQCLTAISHMKEQCLIDDYPLIVRITGGYSSFAMLNILWLAISELKQEGMLNKPIIVAHCTSSTDIPLLSFPIRKLLSSFKTECERQSINVDVFTISQSAENSFWPQLLKGNLRFNSDIVSSLYVDPMNNFIVQVINRFGFATIVEPGRSVRPKQCSRSALFHNANVFWPLAGWDRDDAWISIFQSKAKWLNSGKDLIPMYGDLFSEHLSKGRVHLTDWDVIEEMITYEENQWLEPLFVLSRKIFNMRVNNVEYTIDSLSSDLRLVLLEMKKLGPSWLSEYVLGTPKEMDSLKQVEMNSNSSKEDLDVALSHIHEFTRNAIKLAERRSRAS